MKKLIFLRNGEKDAEKLMKYDDLICYYIDGEIQLLGFRNFEDKISQKEDILENLYTVTTYPCLLSLMGNDGNPMWWNENEHKWEIYFVEKGKLKNIQEYTDRELRMAHNIEKLYLSGGLDNE